MFPFQQNIHSKYCLENKTKMNVRLRAFFAIICTAQAHFGLRTPYAKQTSAEHKFYYITNIFICIPEAEISFLIFGNL